MVPERPVARERVLGLGDRNHLAPAPGDGTHHPLVLRRDPDAEAQERALIAQCVAQALRRLVLQARGCS